jgi:hypothetical protein
MRTRRGGQATGGELDTVLRHHDVAQGADTHVHDGERSDRRLSCRCPAAGRSPVLCHACPRGVPLSVSAVRPRQRHDVQ